MSLTSAKKLLLGGSGIDRDARALAARMSPRPSAARLKLISDTIASLKREGIWTKADAIYFLAAHSLQAALLNWRQDKFNCEVRYVSGPIEFEADRYVKAGGSGLSTSLIPSDAVAQGKVYSLNNAHVTIWAVQHSFSLRTIAGSADYVTYHYNTNGQLAMNSSGNINFGATNPYDRPVSISRSDSSGVYYSIENIETGYIGLPSNPPPSPIQPIGLSWSRDSGGAELAYPNDLRCASIGAALTAAQIASLHSIQRNFLSRVGAAP